MLFELIHCLFPPRLPFFSPLVDADEIKRLGKRFKKLDLDNSGSLSVEEFMSLPELQQNPLVQRVIDIFDTDGNGEVDFKGEAKQTLHLHHCMQMRYSRKVDNNYPADFGKDHVIKHFVNEECFMFSVVSLLLHKYSFSLNQQYFILGSYSNILMRNTNKALRNVASVKQTRFDLLFLFQHISYFIDLYEISHH